MAEIKTGQFSLHHPKPMKIKGGISSVRKIYAGREGNIWKYSMLGSQNAITETPEIPKTEAEKKEEKKKDETKLADDIAKKVIDDMTKQEEAKRKEEEAKKEAQKGLLGGGGKGTQSESSKIIQELTKKEREKEAKAEAEKKAEEERSANAKLPAEAPPYDLMTEQGKAQLEELDKYYVDKFGKKESAIKRMELKEDSEGFTLAIEMIRKINREITAFNRDDARRWKQWANNILVEFGDKIIDYLGKGTQLALAEFGGIPPPASAPVIDKVKDILKYFKPTEPQDFVRAMKELQAKLLEGKPHWKAKWNAIAKASFEKKMKEWDMEFGGVMSDFEKLM